MARDPTRCPEHQMGHISSSCETVLANNAKSFETVTPMKQRNGMWEIPGYFVE